MTTSVTGVRSGVAQPSVSQSSTSAVEAADQPPVMQSGAAGAVDGFVGSSGSLAIGGRYVPRLEPPAVHARELSQAALDLYNRALMTIPPGSGITDHRSAAALAGVLRHPPASQQEVFGEVTIIKVGGFNATPSASFLARAAQYGRRTILATQDYDPKNPAHAPRRLTTFDGHDVSSLNLFIVGGEHRRVSLSYGQAADQLIEQLDALHRAPELLGVDVLSSKATFIGHSLGGLAVTNTRARLGTAFPDLFGRVVTLGSPFGGPKSGSDWLLGLSALVSATALQPLYPNLPRSQSIFFDAETLRQRFPASSRDLVDLAVGAVLGPPPRISWSRLWPRIDHRDIRPGFRWMAAGKSITQSWLDGWRGPLVAQALSALGGSNTSDGVVELGATRFGAQTLTLSGYDHQNLFESARVIDEVVAKL